jgi:iron complex outermembrane receptor protein
MRGTYAEGFRAPSIGELFGSASRFDATLDDPCSIGLDGSPPTGNEAGCDALGVPDGYQQANSQISVTTGGNDNLDPELADSWTAGMVYSPGWGTETGWSQRLDFEFTYYRHEVEGAIQAIDAQTQLNLCVENAATDPTNVFCQGITRASTGDINGFNNRLVNIGQIDTDGYDLNVNWVLPDTDFGTFSVKWLNTWVADYEAVGVNGIAQPQGEGVEVNDSGIPEWTSNLRLDWRYGDWSAAWTVRHLSDLRESCGDAASFDVCSDPDDPNGASNSLSSTTYNDVQVGWGSPFGVEGLKLTAGVTNLFDEDPPICLSCSLNGYDASNYDVPGRFWYVQARYKF